MTEHWPMIVDGEPRAATSGGTYVRENPATGEVVGTFPQGQADDVDQAVSAARRGLEQGEWARASGSDRAAVLHRLADALRRRADDYARWESRQVGIPYGQISWLNWYCADVVDFYAGAARMRFGRSIDTSELSIGLTLEEPVGVVGVITPWNFPLVLTIWKVAAALAAGCSLVVKPASYTPITIIELAADLLEAGLPPGVCNVVTGPGGVVGEAMVDHPGIDKIAFTGETSTGRRIMARAAATLKRVSLELGGKSPLIVMPDADLEAASQAVLECFYNSGQVCNVPSRLVADGSIAPELIDRVVGKAEALRLGPEDDADLGPLVHHSRLARVVDHLEEARRAGARVVTGGSAPQELAGHPYLAPTVLDDLAPDARILREEVFGPVLAVQRSADLEEAIRLANAGPFGLAAGIFTSDLDAALMAARRLRAGTVWVNIWNKTYPELPTGGLKASGIGRELGLEGLSAYLEPKTVQLNPAGTSA